MDYRTTVFNVKELRQELILITLNEVIKAMEFKGYNSSKQLVGYLTTGDEKYITSYDQARRKIKQYDRNELLLAILNSYLGK